MKFGDQLLCLLKLWSVFAEQYALHIETTLPQMAYTSFDPLSSCICFSINLRQHSKVIKYNITKDGHVYFRFHVTQKVGLAQTSSGKLFS